MGTPTRSTYAEGLKLAASINLRFPSFSPQPLSKVVNSSNVSQEALELIAGLCAWHAPHPSSIMLNWSARRSVDRHTSPPGQQRHIVLFASLHMLMEQLGVQGSRSEAQRSAVSSASLLPGGRARPACEPLSRGRGAQRTQRTQQHSHGWTAGRTSAAHIT
jgi:hypothetical protein